MSKVELKIIAVDNGNCRVLYKAKGRRTKYCVQQDWRESQVDSIKDTCVLYVFDGEPSHEVPHENKVYEVPAGDTRIEKDVARWIMSEPKAALK